MPYIVTSIDTVNVPEGGKASFNVRLSSRPSRDTTVKVARTSGDSSITVSSGTSLTFTRENWSSWKTVTLAAATDSDTTAGTATISLTASRITTKTVKAVEVEKTVTPPAVVAIVAEATSLTVAEGNSVNMRIKLSAAPTTNVSLSVARTSGDSTIFVASGGSLSFTPTDWSTWRSVTIFAQEDGVLGNTSAVFTVSGSSLTPINVSVAKQNATVQKLVVSSASVSVPEGGEAGFTVKLAVKPAANVVVTCQKVSGDSDFSLGQGASLTFTPTDYATPKSVSIVTVRDGDTTAGSALFRLSSAGIASVDVTATEVDNWPVATAPQKVVIDPVTRIEGHLKIETRVEGGVVAEAWSTATLFRGIETILGGRDPMDAPLITQRLCGVCTYIHMLSASRCLEDAWNVNMPANARIVRNLLNGVQFLHDHIVHFYHLHAVDWVDVVSALDGSPTGAKALASAWDSTDFAAAKTRLAGFVQNGQLGPFKNAYWGHGAYRLTADENLLLFGHYMAALKKQAEIAKMHAIFGGKNPHPQSVVVGGVTPGGELGKSANLTAFRAMLADALEFVENVYLPDVKIVAKAYGDWASIGGFDNMLAYGEFPEGPVEPDDLFSPRGYIMNRDLYNVKDVDLAGVTEHVAHSWYSGSTAKHPSSGETVPQYTGEDPAAKYSWLKAPRLFGKPMEVGPLARVLVAYGRGQAEYVQAVDDFLADVGLRPEDLFSTLGRTAARAIETLVIGQRMVKWLDELEANIKGGNKRIYQTFTKTASAQGFGLNEAPRGALGHWVNIASGKIGNYQMVVPSTWNFGPRDAAGQAGPVEVALVNVPVLDAAQPIELLRVLHSFDPCIACGVHVIEAETGEDVEVKVL